MKYNNFQKKLPKNDMILLKNDNSLPNSSSSAANKTVLNLRRLGLTAYFKKEKIMTPLVRAPEQAPAAAPRISAQPVAIHTLQIVPTIAEIKAPAPAHIEDQGTSMLDKRRRRRARMSNRH